VIRVTRLDGTSVLVNVDQIESIEETPDTIVSLTNGHKILARETPQELVDRVVAFRRRVTPEMNGTRNSENGTQAVQERR
jgi:flagellar protein FlbD